MELIELIPILEARVDNTLSGKRARHSRAVALFAADLCIRNDVDPLRGKVAGLAHDLAKELPVSEQRRLASMFRGSIPISAFFTDKLIHGPAAASILERDYALDDFELLEAIAQHTIGRVDMSLLGIILYCADKIEPGRRGITPEFRERCALMTPREMQREVVGGLIEWLKSQDHSIAPETIRLYADLGAKVSAG